MLGSRWVSTTIDNSSELNWNKTDKNRLFSPALSWVDLLVTLKWPCYDLGVTPLSSQTPTNGTMCTCVEIYPMYLKYRTGHWSKHDNRCVIWSNSAIWVRSEIRVIWWGITQAWGQSTRYFGTLVLEYRFCSTRRYSVLELLKSTCTCTQVLLKIKVLLTSTYEYFTSTSHLKLIQNSSQTNPKSVLLLLLLLLLQDMEHSDNDSFTIRLAIILKNDLLNTLKLFQNWSNYL